MYTFDIILSLLGHGRGQKDGQDTKKIAIHSAIFYERLIDYTILYLKITMKMKYEGISYLG